MIGAKFLPESVYLGAKEIPRQCRVVIRCSPREMSWIRLGFHTKSREGTLSGGGSRTDRAPGMSLLCFKGRPKKGQKVEVESVQGGEDVWDAASAEANSYPEHLVVMVNGIIGSAEDWRYAAEQFVRKLPDEVIVHRSECNFSRLTFDGVDLMGERLANEDLETKKVVGIGHEMNGIYLLGGSSHGEDNVWSVVSRRPWVRKISFVAHSLGGLVARYAIGKLYVPFPERVSFSTGNSSSEDHSRLSKEFLEQPNESRIAGLEPMNFITFATPHLGSRGHKQLPFLCGVPFLEKRASQTAHWIVGRTGKHLFLTDSDNGKPPLLLQMVNDCDDLKFLSALRSFKRRVAYANANYDHMVGWRTSSIRRQHELPKSDLLLKYERYPHIVYIESDNDEDFHEKASPAVSHQIVDLEEEMIRGLTQVPWERIDVSFQKSRQRYIAHNTIQGSYHITY
ncbi:PREDICTED: uncharacterized protein LOC104603138 isoform X2 [Nelumbo nucifera]|uniref:Uncharacterized protein LOC104603138 isoform X2 n=1 Tax=Nelumbo nucifera TaxID=4432 RepID=A0A1U8ARK6_NELNU|nr:PREDICTED: uncharacterized protein LOC104603138 isoform X2 [Nelumbo nucifera]